MSESDKSLSPLRKKENLFAVCIGKEILLTRVKRFSCHTISIEVAVGISSIKISPTVHHLSRSIALRASIVEVPYVSSVALLPLPHLFPPLFAR